MKIAVIDLGTNSVHMLMAEILPNFTFEVLGREKEMIRLGDRTLNSGFLSPEKMELGLETMKKFKYLAQSKGIQKFRAVATSAVRESHNGGEFLKRIRKETGINVNVITGEEEGRLIYQGVKHSMPLGEKNTLILDIGGGSVEIILVTDEEILSINSLKLGSSRVYGKFLKKQRNKDYQKLAKYLKKELAETKAQIKELGFSQVIGTSGTLCNLADMAHYLHHNPDSSPPRNAVLKRDDLKEIFAQLKNSTQEERMERKGLDSTRVDLILGGSAVAWALFEEFGIDQMTYCDQAIREGMIYHYIRRNRKKIRSEAEIPDVRKRSVLRLAHKCDFEREHARQTARLALQIFDRTQALHGRSSLDRELLEYCALLHDIGYHISYDRHHHHAYYLIKNVRLNGFSEEEIQIMALVARYHRKGLPKKRKHPEFAILEKSEQKRVMWLSAILRLADALDRSHFSVVQNVSLRTYAHKIIFQVEAQDDAEYEIWEAYRKSKLFARLTKREVSFKAKVLPKRKMYRGKGRVSRVGKLRQVQ